MEPTPLTPGQRSEHTRYANAITEERDQLGGEGWRRLERERMVEQVTFLKTEEQP